MLNIRLLRLRSSEVAGLMLLDGYKTGTINGNQIPIYFHLFEKAGVKKHNMNYIEISPYNVI
jgi:hypothetical protein